MTDDKMADKIAALLKKAESTEFAEEAESLTAAAERMMLKYGIEQAIINAKRAGSDHASNEAIIRVIVEFKGVYGKGMHMAMTDVASEFQAVKLVNGSDRKTSRLWLIGYESDVKQLEMLMTSLQLQCASALNKWWTGVRPSAPGAEYTAMQKFKMRRQFIISFGAGAAYRIANARREVIEASTDPGTALALVDRSSQVNAWAHAQYNLVTGKSVSIKGGGGGSSTAGWTAGKNASTGEGALKQTTAIRS